MLRPSARSLATGWLLAVLLLAPTGAATVRFTDFETPTKTTFSQPSLYEDYRPFTADMVRFSRGYRPSAIPGQTSSTTYRNWNGQDQVEIYFDVPVKNITFTMYGFYNDSRPRAATIQYSSLPFDPSPHSTLTPNPALYYSPDQGPTIVTVPVANIRYMTVYFGGQPFCIDDFSFDDSGPYDYTLTGQILDGTAQESKHLGATTTAYAQVPLGLELKLALLNNGNPTTAQYTLAPAVLTGVANPTLYPTNVALEYDQDTPAAAKTFRAVHIGTQTLYINAGPNTPVLNVTVGVFDPGALGPSDNAFDQQLVVWGNKRGIPPHILKGLIRQEGPFDPLEYRYEPLNGDTGDIYVSDLHDVRSDEPWLHYRMATSDGLPKGDLLIDLNQGSSYAIDDDISPREKYDVPRGADGKMRALEPTDVCPAACVSAGEIYAANDGDEHWSKYANPKTFDASDAGDVANLNSFTAQTPLAASYGLMQTMYAVAMEYGWATDDGRQNPSLLFDTAENWAVGGGSLSLGTLEFYKRYRKCRLGDWATDPDFDDSDEYQSMIIDALNYYNHGNKQTNMTYGQNAWNYSLKFLPTHPASKIFP